MTLHHRTPVWPDPIASAALGRPVWLKMEALQPVGSFKIRGIGRRCERAVAGGAARLVASSGGNAGLAAAWAGRQLGVPVECVVPSTTPGFMRARIAAEGADVTVHGNVWDQAHEYATERARRTGGALIPPFDHPDIFAGNATLVAELAEQLGERPGAVVTSVGGGGLLCGVAQGLHDTGWADVPIIAAETEGAASFAASVRAGRPVAIDAITSIAKTLGAITVAAAAHAWTSRHEIHSTLVTDGDAVRACLGFLNRHRLMVEPSCGAALAVIESAEVARHAADGAIVVVVCGGAMVTLEALLGWAGLP